MPALPALPRPPLPSELLPGSLRQRIALLAAGTIGEIAHGIEWLARPPRRDHRPEPRHATTILCCTQGRWVR